MGDIKMESMIGAASLTTILLLGLAIILLWKGIKVVPQSEVYVV